MINNDKSECVVHALSSVCACVCVCVCACVCVSAYNCDLAFVNYAGIIMGIIVSIKH